MAEYRINYTQSNFTGGIVAAELYGRNDFNKVKTGLKKCINWTIREAGGLEFRRGTKYVNTVPSDAGNKFKTASISDILIVFGARRIYYLKPDNSWGAVAYPSTPNLDSLMFEELKQRLYFYDGTINLSEIYLVEETAAINDGTTTYERDVTSDATGAYAWDYDGTTVYTASETPVSGDSIYSDTSLTTNVGTVSIVRVQNVPHARYTQFEETPSGLTIAINDAGTQPSPYVGVNYCYAAALLANDGTAETVGVESNEDEANADLAGTQYMHIAVTLSQDLATKYDGGKLLIYKRYQGEFYYLTSLTVDAGTTSYPYDDHGEFSVDMSKSMKRKPVYLTTDGYLPYVNSIADYGQRLFLTLSLQLSESDINIIFTTVGDVNSLAFSNTRGDDEAGYLAAPISHYDSWGRVISGLDLIFGTSYTMQRISGYGDFQLDPVLFDGVSKTVQPIRTRRSLIYTNTNNRNVYDLSFNEYGQYDNPDLTLLIKYIFENKTIKRLEIKDYPVKTIYVLCADGDLYCLTYVKEQNIYAWYKLEHFGKVHDIHVVNLETEDEIYIVTKDNGNYIVELAYHRTDTVYTDCTVRVPRASITDNVITGLPACLEGKKVRVFDLGNNRYYGDYDIAHPQTVEEGGNIVQIDDVEFDGYTVVDGSVALGTEIYLEGDVLVGLPYYAVAETIPLEFQDSNGNSTIGRKKTISDAYLRYGDSRGLTYKTLGREYDCGICKKDIVDNAEFLERGQVRLNTESEYKWDSTIKLLQRQPYPARIESITLGLNFNDKS